MKLFLDDIRTVPEGWEGVRTYEECVFRLGTGEYDEVSLDYSLGGRFTGLDVLKWMTENQKYPPRLNIHSSHPYGRQTMRAYVLEHFSPAYPLTMKSYLY